jgi:hypothetical protein
VSHPPPRAGYPEAIVGAEADADPLEEAGIEVHRIADPAQVS